MLFKLCSDLLFGCKTCTNIYSFLLTDGSPNLLILSYGVTDWWFACMYARRSLTCRITMARSFLSSCDSIRFCLLPLFVFLIEFWYLIIGKLLLRWSRNRWIWNVINCILFSIVVFFYWVWIRIMSDKCITMDANSIFPSFPLYVEFLFYQNVFLCW